MTSVIRRFAALPWRKVGAFSLLQFGAAIVPLLVLPVVTRLVGAPGWVALSIGMSLGAIVALVINFGWPLRGPGLVAGVPLDEAARRYWESVCFRLAISIPIVIVGSIVSAVLSPPEFSYLAVLMTIAVGFNGMSGSWYFIGRGEPGRIAITDLLPKVAASALSVIILLATGAAWVYPVLALIAAVASPIIANKLVIGRFWMRWAHRDLLIGHGRSQLAVVAAGLVLAGYGAFSVPLVTLSGASLAAVASFAAAVRLRSMVQSGQSAVTSGFQGWAIEKVDGRRRPRRMIASFFANGAAGFVIAVGFAVLAPVVTPLLFGPEVTLPPLAAVFAGAACLFYSMSASLSYHILAPFGWLRWIAVSTTAASAVGVPLILVLSAHFGAEGATFAVMTAELVVVLLQAPAAAVCLRAALRDEHHLVAAQVPTAE